MLVLLFILLSGLFYKAICFKSCLLFCSCVYGPFGVKVASLGEGEGVWDDLGAFLFSVRKKI